MRRLEKGIAIPLFWLHPDTIPKMRRYSVEEREFSSQVRAR